MISLFIGVGFSLKICVISEYTTTISGIGAYVQYLATDLIKKGHEVFLITDDVINENPSGVKVYQFNCPRLDMVKNKIALFKYIFSFVLFTLRVLKKEKPDIIHSQAYYDFYIAKMASLCYKIPVVESLHGYSYICPKDNRIRHNKLCDVSDEWECRKEVGLLFNLRKMLIRRVFAFLANGIIATNDLLYQFFKKIAPKKTYLMPNGIDMNHFYPRDVKKEQNTILFLGGFRPVKRFDILLSAFIDALQKNPDLRLTVIGDLNPVTDLYLKVNLEKFKMGIQKKIDDNQVRDRITFLNFIPYSKLPEIYSMNSLFVSTSASEVNPLSFLESLACGVPVIALVNPLSLNIICSNASRLSADILENVTKSIDSDTFHEIRRAFSASHIGNKLLRLYQGYCKRAEEN